MTVYWSFDVLMQFFFLYEHVFIFDPGHSNFKFLEMIRLEPVALLSGAIVSNVIVNLKQQSLQRSWGLLNF